MFDEEASKGTSSQGMWETSLGSSVNEILLGKMGTDAEGKGCRLSSLRKD